MLTVTSPSIVTDKANDIPTGTTLRWNGFVYPVYKAKSGYWPKGERMKQWEGTCWKYTRGSVVVPHDIVYISINTFIRVPHDHRKAI
jgi:hypothetical protein